MRPELKEIDASVCLVADGAWGTELQKLGLAPGSSPEYWNLAHPQEVACVAQKYVEAGSGVILTNTFGGNRFVLSRHDLVGKMTELNLRGAQISKEAADGKALVFGSMGPTGVLLADSDITEEEIYETYCRQSEALHRGGADAILIETMIDVGEMELAARATHDSTPLPVVLSMTFDLGREKTQTIMGVTPEQAVAAMEHAGAWMIGANCGLGPEHYVQVCRRMRTVSSKPIWIKANAGIPQMVDDEIVYPQDPATFASYARQLKAAGANVIGGCCGTTPEHIRRLREALAEEIRGDSKSGEGL